MSKQKRKIATIDAETDPFKLGRVPKPFLWGFFDGDNYEEFETVAELLEFLSDKRLIIYAHNGGKFDYFYMLDYLEPFADITIINGRIAKFKIGDCEFRDSINILPVALSAYQKTEIDYNKFEECERHKHKKEISAYLKDDCVFLYEMVEKYIKTYGVNLTLAGTALKQWRKISGLDVPDSSKEFYQEFGKYYYGGRVECFEKGIFKGNFKSYDINSAYPYAMLEEHPYGTFNIEREFNGKFIGQDFYTIKAIAKGSLPLRTDTGLSFPHGEYVFYATGWEIIAGLETNTLEIIKVEKTYHFPQTTNFKCYVDHFYEMKKAAGKAKDKAGYLFAKLFLNSLYGKFAANPEKYSETMILDKKYINAGIEDGYEFAGELGKWALMRQDLCEEKQKYYNVATAASITGYVRSFLWRHIHAVAQNNKVLYCDTDCIFFEGDKNLPFEENNELGGWEKEGEYSRGAIAGKKLYAFEHKTGGFKQASKGCRLEAEQIFEIAGGAEIVYQDISPIYSVFKEPRFQSRKIRRT